MLCLKGIDQARIEAGRMPITESLVDFAELLLDVERILDAGAVDVVQPDPIKMGGII